MKKFILGILLGIFISAFVIYQYYQSQLLYQGKNASEWEGIASNYEQALGIFPCKDVLEANYTLEMKKVLIEDKGCAFPTPTQPIKMQQ
jgi:hypothetical protein